MELKNDTYYMQGVRVLDLCEQYGTPLYLYDADKIEDQLKKMKKAFKGLKVRFQYAAKALTNSNILRLMNHFGTGLDVVSIQEAHIGLKAGFKPEQILYTPNCVSFNEIKEAVALGVMINIDNISILEQFGHEYGSTVPCCIRLNPHVMAGGHHKISTGHIDSKFGISVLQMRHLQRVIKTNNINVVGLHVHTGSDILDAEVFLRGAQIIFDAALEFPDLKFLDFGSGFKVAYRQGDPTTDMQQVGERLTEAVKAFAKEYGSEPEIWFEPGKYLVSESGYLLVRTNVIKTTPATVFAGVDSGMNHLMRPTLYDSYHDMFNLSNPTGTNRVYSVVGYICETDTLGWDRKMNELREGDIIAIKNAGAYGFSMASNYNSRLRPAEVLIFKGKAQLIRRRETLDDLLRTQPEVSFV